MSYVFFGVWPNNNALLIFLTFFWFNYFNCPGVQTTPPKKNTTRHLRSDRALALRLRSLVAVPAAAPAAGIDPPKGGGEDFSFFGLYMYILYLFEAGGSQNQPSEDFFSFFFELPGKKRFGLVGNALPFSSSSSNSSLVLEGGGRCSEPAHRPLFLWETLWLVH